MMGRIVVFTLGCKVNQYESDVMIGALTRLGFEVFDKFVPAEAYIINTCAVTREAERKSRQAITRARSKNADAAVYICGCASEKARDSFQSLGVKAVFGTADKFDVLKLFGAEITAPKALGQQAYVNIQDGCNNFCSYCVIPYLRGRSRSRTIEQIVPEVATLAKHHKKIVLTGINLAMYGKDIGCELYDLIDALADIDAEISVGSFYVEGINDRLLDSFSRLRNFNPRFHLSLQTGDDVVLESMGRRYTTGDYSLAVKKIRKVFNDAVLTTDIIVGFPTETAESHDNTMRFIKEMKFNDIHIFVFSPREGTKAWNMPRLPHDIVENRRKALSILKQQLLKENN